MQPILTNPSGILWKSAGSAPLSTTWGVPLTTPITTTQTDNPVTGDQAGNLWRVTSIGNAIGNSGDYLNARLQCDSLMSAVTISAQGMTQGTVNGSNDSAGHLIGQGSVSASTTAASTATGVFTQSAAGSATFAQTSGLFTASSTASRLTLTSASNTNFLFTFRWVVQMAGKLLPTFSVNYFNGTAVTFWIGPAITYVERLA